MFGDDNSQEGMIDPPYHDLLNLRFRGDAFSILLPFCEVANGDIKMLKDGIIKVLIKNNSQEEELDMSYEDFAKLVEEAFDTKEIIKLSIQPSGSFDVIDLL